MFDFHSQLTISPYNGTDISLNPAINLARSLLS